MNSSEVYIIFPGIRADDIDSWYTVKTLRAALLARNIESKVICFSDYTEEEFRKLPVPIGAVLIQVFTYSVYTKFQKLIQIMNNWKTVFVNNCTAHYNVSNKLSMYGILERNNLCGVKTIGINNYSTIEDASPYFETLGSPLVLKPAYGFLGRSTFLCSTQEEIITNLNSLRTHKDTKNSPAILQEYVRDYPDMFVRVYSTPSFMVGFLSIVPPFETVKFLNYNKYKFRIPYKVAPDLEEYVRKCLKCLSINAGACDVLIRDNGYFLTDVNSIGDYKVFNAICNVNFGEEVVKYLYSKIRGS